MLKQTIPAPGGATTTTQNTVPLTDILRLLDDTVLNFVLHTHHPATHLEYGEKVSADPWTNTRRECPEAPVAIQTGWGVLG